LLGVADTSYALYDSLFFQGTDDKLLASLNTLYYFTALQSFVFAMRYLQSATKCALSKPCATLKCITYTSIAVTSLYTSALIGTLIVICLTFPGWDTYLSDNDKYLHWLNNVWYPCCIVQNNLWFVLSLVSACITVYSVHKMV
jgi:hypothetical protein